MFAVKSISRRDYEEILGEYKTVSSKKAFMTREIKACEEHLESVTKAYDKRNEGIHYGWYLGDRIFKSDISRAEMNLTIVKRIREEL